MRPYCAAFAWLCVGVVRTWEVSHAGGASNDKIKCCYHPHDGRMEAANPGMRAAYGPHVGPSFEVKLTPNSQRPHIGLTSYLQRTHGILTGCRRKYGNFSAWVRQMSHGICICEAAFVQIQQPMRLSCSPPMALVRNALKTIDNDPHGVCETM